MAFEVGLRGQRRLPVGQRSSVRKEFQPKVGTVKVGTGKMAVRAVRRVGRETEERKAKEEGNTTRRSMIFESMQALTSDIHKVWFLMKLIIRADVEA
mmetsp:Transcript_49810/g.132154  ORF Transcript_49810/g.132154 Transcript_49810/m.132154 type:complete len:97 (-) Transcript_49810:164-454(-)